MPREANVTLPLPIFDEATVTSDPLKFRTIHPSDKAIYKQVQQILMDDLPTYYAWYRPFLHVIRKKFAGYVDSAAEYGVFTDMESMYVNG